MARDIEHEQLTESTTEQLIDRLFALVERYHATGYPMAQLRELHLIRSELYCRHHGIESKPGVCYAYSCRDSRDLELTK